MTEQKPDLLSMTPEELALFFTSIGQPAFRAKQVFSAFAKGQSIGEITTLPKALRETLLETTEDRMPRVEQKLISKLDGTVKYLFKLFDGHMVESVLMRYEHGNTLCISSQVGCAMGCRFCASTIGGRVRNLSSSELLGQVAAAGRDSGERIDGIVMMGIGEPLDNYDNVLRFLRLVNRPEGLGIGYRHISLSTCGIVPRIRELAKENLPITLSVSLHAADDARRSAIMPVNRRWGIDELLSACADYFAATGRRISFEYTLIAGENDREEEAVALARRLRRAFPGNTPIHVNLIRVNEVKETGYRRPSSDSAKRFCEMLCSLGVTATVRRRLGADVNAACGQLRRQSQRSGEESHA
jgi:23S rRNA (adenine2503-C2)-methyltransferase